ncbi:MAG: hypothetical protein NT062_32795 [Proteobacteria bacterium]|nr:hypothetical protein [Pseudomonadota bacterium]
MIFRGLSWLMAALFGVCVALQYNDPDPIRWMAIYGAAMIISIALPFRKRVAIAGVVVGLGAAVWSITLLTGVWGHMGFSDLWLKMSEKGGAVEEGREAGGMAIEAAWLLLASLYRSTRPDRA